MWLIVGLVLPTAAWMAFDGAHALLTGDFVTPRSGEYAGQLGPWASLLRSIGLEPRSTGVKLSFLLFGLTYLAALGAFLVRPRRAWVGLVVCAAGALLFVPVGTFTSLIVLVLLASLRPRRSAACLFPGALAVLCSGCVVGSALEATRSAPVGSVMLDSATLGRFSLTPTTCLSGERQVFLGADFLDSQGIATRLIVDPAGAASLRFYTVARPLEEGTLFRRADCSQFELALDRTGWQINEIHDLHVSLRFDCRAATGDTAAGWLAVDHCH